jgi:hypothetical protein
LMASGELTVGQSTRRSENRCGYGLCPAAAAIVQE